MATYHGDYIGLEGLVQGDKTEVENKIDLVMGLVSLIEQFLGSRWPGLATNGGNKEEHGDGLLSASHDEGRQREIAIK